MGRDFSHAATVGTRPDANRLSGVTVIVRSEGSPPSPYVSSGDLGYEVAFLALAESAAASLADGRADPRDPAELAASIAEARGIAPAAVSLALLTRVAMSAQLLRLPADRAVELQLGTLASLAGLTGASLWSIEPGAVACRFSLGDGDGGADERAAVERLLGDSARGGELVAAAVLLEGAPAAAVVVRPDSSTGVPVEPFVAVACGALGFVLEREQLLHRDAETQATLVAAHERRLTRLGFDLHDGPLQDVAVMAADLYAARLRAQTQLAPPGRERMVGCLDDLLARLRELDADLREVAHSLETVHTVNQPLAEALQREMDALARKTAIAAQLSVTGEVDDLTDSQKIALMRIVHEGLANVREHSGASRVTVTLNGSQSSTELEIADDGSGFDIETALVESARRGRLGLVGSSERIRLLGGTFTVCSGPTGGTRVIASLPRWAP